MIFVRIKDSVFCILYSGVITMNNKTPCALITWHNKNSLTDRPLDLASTSAGCQNRDFPNQTNGTSLTIYSGKISPKAK